MSTCPPPATLPGLAVVLGAIFPTTIGAALTEQADTERALLRVLVLTPSAALPEVTAECERRREHMTERAAYESVGDDLQTGRWIP